MNIGLIFIFINEFITVVEEAFGSHYGHIRCKLLGKKYLAVVFDLNRFYILPIFTDQSLSLFPSQPDC